MSASYFGLRQTQDPHLWKFPVSAANCAGPEGRVYMFGGAGLGAAIAALEHVSQREIAWASAQFLAPAFVGAELDLNLAIIAKGARVVQAQAAAQAGGKQIFLVQAALRPREGERWRDWDSAPAIPKPDACVEAEWGLKQAPGTIYPRLEKRVAPGERLSGWSGPPSSDGVVRFWLRPRDDAPITGALLAVFGDFIPEAIGLASGGRMTGASLDNSLRIIGLAPTRWVLCDVQVRAIGHGMSHGRMRMFSEDGALLAVASQTMTARRRSSVVE